MSKTKMNISANLIENFNNFNNKFNANCDS